ncbi:tannase/feruloyl esterase family alpha/beta hydrolase [Rhodococcus opacus]|uniref:tannase/feruloyl esterase family alpha/beta hydrolase n=1 Tax=Rhodococcus opacus TaxID=37919 RepID=UPI002473E665|nr:tannase/feruloyl esterase family alpha/beta hydrolase [Rhodococcus opacus]MDH6289268.1 putative esterase [Rhodococcus opacus]
MGRSTMLTALAVVSLVAVSCGDPAEDAAAGPIPRMSPAVGAVLTGCADLGTRFEFTNTTLTESKPTPAGELTVGGHDIRAHCTVTGKMNERVSPVDGQRYAIGFEMRLPEDWNGRFFYQGNGGIDGNVPPAVGAVSGGGPTTNALDLGFAVISSDAGHTAEQNPLFGIDPQARLDYGYQAVASLTPMAKALITTAYGKAPDHSYIGGTSNGGRHTMVAASRLPDQYDGYLAGAPGFNLPKASVAQMYGAQQYAAAATDPDNLESAFDPTARAIVAQAILAECDNLDGADDGLVHDVRGCATAFDLATDVPTCTGEFDGACLSREQTLAVSNVFAGAVNSRGEALYSTFPYDPGLISEDWAQWEFVNSITNRDPSAAFIFTTPPSEPGALADTRAIALGFDMDADAGKISDTDSTYTESAMSFMTPPDPTDLDELRGRGAKMVVVHGASDPVFSVDDTTRWYESLTAKYGDTTSDFARFFRVPGMGHSRGGPSTDQYDGLSALVDWVENGRAPDSIIATARGVGNPGGANPEVPPSWNPGRTRPLCPFPQVARYAGSGDIERAESFDCR